MSNNPDECELPKNKRFKTRMLEMPNEIVDLVAEYARKDPNPQIAMNPDTSAYMGIRDPRYNLLPPHQKHLAQKIWRYGSFEQVKAILDRWYEKGQDWDDFIKDYPKNEKGKIFMNPCAVKPILIDPLSFASYGGGGIRKKMRTKRRISKKHNTKKRTSKK